jgi:hypothetical protein
MGRSQCTGRATCAAVTGGATVTAIAATGFSSGALRRDSEGAAAMSTWVASQQLPRSKLGSGAGSRVEAGQQGDALASGCIGQA